MNKDDLFWANFYAKQIANGYKDTGDFNNAMKWTNISISYYNIYSNANKNTFKEFLKEN